MSALGAGLGGFIGALVGSLVITPRSDGVIVITVRPLKFLYAKTIEVTQDPKSFVEANVKAILIKASSENTDSVFIGNSGVSPISGFELRASEAISMNVDNPNNIYIMAKSGTQKVHIIALGGEAV